MPDLVFIMNRPEPCKAEVFLRKDCGISHRQLTKLRHTENGLTVNGKLLKTIDTVKQGDCIHVHMVDKTEIIPNPDLIVPLVFESDEALIFDKPSGMPVHPSQCHHTDTLGNAFTAKYPNLTFRPVHRLDNDTSGLICVAKNAISARSLPDRLQKKYIALVSGNPPDSGTIDAPVGRCEDSIIARRITPDGKKAVTHFQVLQRGEKYTLVSFRLETGRTHQIRLHMSHIGCPLAGDFLYGGDMGDLQRHALHCAEMEYTDLSGNVHQIHSPIPDDMQKCFVQSAGISEFSE
ncbi:MAG TPA: RluA family pseudouridine synthase [Ruminococcus sp.]|nr:RluA family pseudouridine synthase [Ruminococcus sp.]